MSKHNNDKTAAGSDLSMSAGSEIHNANRIPWCEMSENAQAWLCHYWQKVEAYDRDACAWVPNRVCPRQWNAEAYRLPESLFQNK